MKSLEIIGFKRANLGKTEAKALRLDANVPCVLYGGKDQVHFYVPMILFRDLVYTPEVHKVDLNIEGDKYEAILQDVQFHPVNEMLLHADFLLLDNEKQIIMDIPVVFEGTAIGIQKGGKLVQKMKKVKVKSLPQNMPDKISININHLDLGKSVRVSELSAENCVILTNPNITVFTIAVPRALRA